MNRTPLLKPKYDNNELRKAVDIHINELIKSKRIEKPDTTPKPLWQELVDESTEMTREIDEYKEIIASQKSFILNLEKRVDELSKELDKLKIEENFQNNLVEINQNRFSRLNIDFTQALQRAIQEEIDMTSLQSQNDGLRAEFNTLTEIENTMKGLLGQATQRIEDQELLEGTLQTASENTQSLMTQINHQIQSTQTNTQNVIQNLINSIRR